MPTLVVDGRRRCALSTWKSNLSHTAYAIRTVICLAQHYRRVVCVGGGCWLDTRLISHRETCTGGLVGDLPLYTLKVWAQEAQLPQR